MKALQRAASVLGLLLGLAGAARGAEEPPETLASLLSGPLLPPSNLFAAGQGQTAYVPERPRMNFDFSGGVFFPIDGDEDFDVGGAFGFKFQGEVVRNLFLGVEFAFAGHDKDAGDLLSDGSVSRFYFLMPIEYDIPIPFNRDVHNPFSFRFGIAPGLQVADPWVDDDLDDQLFLNGLDLDEETMVAFNLRVRAAARFPIGPFFGLILEAAYDWAEAEGEAELTNLLTGERDKQESDVNLSGVSVFFGFQTVF